MMSAAYRVCLAQNPNRILRFIDVGCGGGTKVFTATRFFPKSDGLEYDQGYAQAGQNALRMIGAYDSTLFHGDALTFENYADDDVIYFYRPLRTLQLLQTMEHRIMSTARPGTVLVAPYDDEGHPRPDLDCAHVDGPIFVTGISQAQADQLRLDAQATGTRVLSRSASRHFDAGHWAPIFDAASFGLPAAAN